MVKRMEERNAVTFSLLIRSLGNARPREGAVGLRRAEREAFSPSIRTCRAFFYIKWEITGCKPVSGTYMMLIRKSNRASGGNSRVHSGKMACARSWCIYRF
ncbi:NAC domain-containing protein 68-like [Iris pallida]|uniref:NAC domain-containing protein 68-like n=1 Tax=Iris pallida TaxID=29817 RepID=A0AAX6DG02_IRIPA|nr:NAC domain-containing protein 68-like [Iris pallida]